MAGFDPTLEVGIQLNLMAVRKLLSRGVGELVVFEAATNKSLTAQNRIHCRQKFASGINLTNVTPRACAQSCPDNVEIIVLAQENNPGIGGALPYEPGSFDSI
jgi:hypothetical protein